MRRAVMRCALACSGSAPAPGRSRCASRIAARVSSPFQSTSRSARSFRRRAAGARCLLRAGRLAPRHVRANRRDADMNATPDVLFVTLDSCRYDVFAAATAPNLKRVGPLVRALLAVAFHVRRARGVLHGLHARRPRPPRAFRQFEVRQDLSHGGRRPSAARRRRGSSSTGATSSTGFAGAAIGPSAPVRSAGSIRRPTRDAR